MSIALALPTARGSHGLADAADGFPVAGDVVALVDVGEAVAGHGADVGAGGKRLLAAGDDDAADRFVGVEGLERRAQFVHQLVVQGVELLRTIELHDADLARFRAHFDVGVGHGCSCFPVAID
jgi:hypothetical protein